MRLYFIHNFKNKSLHFKQFIDDIAINFLEILQAWKI